MKTFLFISIILLYSIILNAQTVFEPVNSSVYNYLERLSIAGIINYHDEIKPVGRKEIASFLVAAEKDTNKLSNIDRQDLKFYEKEFADEIDMITGRSSFNIPSSEFLSDKRTGRFRVYSYRDSNFAIYVDPVLGFDAGKKFGASYSHRWNGASLFGYAGSEWGFAMSYVDNEEIGNTIDTSRLFSPEPGFNLTKKGERSIQYDNVQGEVTYSWNTGTVSIGKYYLNWGSGKGGQLIFSDKATSFPLIRFDFYPVKWLKFTYFHGWLKSNVIDSSSIRTTFVSDRPNINEVPKFIAAHMLSLYPNNDFTFSIGESILYSDRFQPVYLIPVLFFRAVDHYLDSRNTNSSAGNAQVFADASYKYAPLRTKIYGTLFIDELSLESIFKGGNLSAVGFTLGFQSIDPVIKNSSFIFEYTRINPFVYMNSNNAQLYTNDGYQLGHWIGSNGYQFFISYRQNLARGFYARLSGNYIVKGQKELPEQQYELPYPPFLYGPHKGYKNIKLELSYEIINKAFINGYFDYTDIYDDESMRTPEFLRGKKSSFGISLGYGL